MNTIKYFVMSLLMLVSVSIQAQPVSKDAAAAVARSFWTSGGSGRRMAPSQARPSLSYTAASAGQVQFYVFNNASRSAFVLVGGDERVPQILGYSNSGAFDYDRAPENVKWWLSQYREQIQALASDNATPYDAAAKTRRNAIAKSNVAPLLTTTWDQIEPYNSALPSFGISYTSEKALATGCVATAMAQIMNYYQYPTSGIGTHSYDSTYTSPAATLTFEADFAGTTYDWANMLDTYSGAFNISQSQAVAKLMYHCGVAVDMEYGQIENGGSAAFNHRASTALVEHFGYDRGISFLIRNMMSDDDWEDAIYNELDHQRPVLYGGQSTVPGAVGGHAFVCDGYKSSDNTYHINWGWGGYCDGYFLLTGTGALKPGASGSGGAGTEAEYTSGQMAVVGIAPDAGNPVNENIWVSDIGLVSSTVAAGENMPMSISINNYSYTSVNIPVGMKFTNTDNGDEYISEYKSQTFAIPTALTFIISSASPLNINTNYIEAGTYTVTPMFKNALGEWTEMHIANGVTLPTVTITVPANNLYAVSEPTFGNQNYVTLTDHTLNFSLKNKTDGSVTGRIVVFIFNTETSATVGYFDAGNITFTANEVKEFNLSEITNSTIAEGTRCTIRIMDYTNSYNILNEWNVYFNVVPQANINYTLSDNQWGTLCLPFGAEVPSGLTVYDVASYSGSTLNYVEVDHIDMNTPYVVSGTPGTYSFTGPQTPAGNYTKGLLVGTTATDATIPAGSYILQKQTANGLGFYQTDAERTAAQYRAYLKLPAKATTIFFPLGGDMATAIDSHTTLRNEPVGVIYNLNGQKLATPQKGINVVNRKKVYIK